MKKMIIGIWIGLVILFLVLANVTNGVAFVPPRGDNWNRPSFPQGSPWSFNYGTDDEYGFYIRNTMCYNRRRDILFTRRDS